MADITLEDLFEFGKGTAVKEFYLPIDEKVPGFDKDWLRKIVLGEGTREEKVQAIKSHEYIQKGDIIAAEFEKLGLQFLFYADGDKKPLKDLSELVFYADNHGMIRRRLNELDPDFMYSLDPTLRYRNYEAGYTREAIDPRVAGIKNIGSFEVNSFGPKYRNGPQQMSATKKFEHKQGTAYLIYSASLNPEGVIDEFNISLEISSNDGPSDFLSKIEVKKEGGKYIPKAEVRVKSERAKQLGSSYGLVSYNFDADGQFDHIKLSGSELVFDRKQIKEMEKIYANLEGIVWSDGQYCLKVTAPDVQNTNINALVTGEGREQHAIAAMNTGKAVLGKDYNLVPIANLGAAPGLTYDLLKIQHYRKFTEDFSKIGIFKNFSVEKLGINYVDAIMNLAGFQNKPAHDVLLLS